MAKPKLAASDQVPRHKVSHANVEFSEVGNPIVNFYYKRISVKVKQEKITGALIRFAKFFSPFLSLFPPILGYLDAPDNLRLETHFKFSAAGSRPPCVCAANTRRCLFFWSDNTVLQMKQPKRHARTHARARNSPLSHQSLYTKLFYFLLRRLEVIRPHAMALARSLSHPLLLSFFSLRIQTFARQPPARSPTPSHRRMVPRSAHTGLFSTAR